jgi:hypothetical protein
MPALASRMSALVSSCVSTAEQGGVYVIVPRYRPRIAHTLRASFLPSAGIPMFSFVARLQYNHRDVAQAQFARYMADGC